MLVFSYALWAPDSLHYTQITSFPIDPEIMDSILLEGFGKVQYNRTAKIEDN